MRVLWYSTKPNVPTGYGTQSDLMVTRLAQAGVDVDFVCTAGLWGTTEKITRSGKEIRLLPHSSYPGKYGTDVIEMHFKHTKADFVWSFIDCFIFDAAVCARLPWLAWTPVDSDPLMHRNIAPLKACRWVMAPTRWGRDMVQKVGITCGYLPCCYSSDQYFYLSHRDKARQALSTMFKRDVPEGKFVNVISANTGSRKNFPAIFQAWARVLKAEPGALMYIHADPTGYFSSGEDLDPLFDLYGVPRDSVLFAPPWQYVSGMFGTDYLNLIHNASAVHVNACYGEGFGLPILEALAAGCPCVVPDFGGAAELVASDEIGIRVTGMRYSTVPGAEQFLVDPVALADAILTAMGREWDRAWISESVWQYEADNVFDGCVKPLLVKVVEELKYSPPF